MKKFIVLFAVLSSSISQAILLEDADILGRHFYTSQTSVLTGAVDIKLAKGALGNLQVNISLDDGKTSFATACEGQFSVKAQEIMIYRCDNNNVRGVIELATTEKMIYLKGGLSSAKLTITADSVQLKEVDVDLKKLGVR